MEWNVEDKDSEGLETVVVSGDFDLYGSPEFYAAMSARLESGAAGLRLDLSGVTYLDSSGVGVVIKLLQAARRLQRDLRFRGVAGAPRKVLRMSNILPLMREDPAKVF